MRKLTLFIITILLVIGCAFIIFGNNESIRSIIPSISQLKEQREKLDTASEEYKQLAEVEFNDKKEKLKKAIEDYNKNKEEYESLVPQSMEDAVVATEMKDIYDVHFLWTIVGNYATEEGINLKFDVERNLTSASSMNNTSDNYVVCDLKFVITGQYINLTDFIYDIEDDDRLNFEINDFEMKKNGDSLEVTLNVREIKVNALNLIENVYSASTEETTETNESTQEVDATTTNAETSSNTATNTSNTSNTTNTTNTSNYSDLVN